MIRVQLHRLSELFYRLLTGTKSKILKSGMVSPENWSHLSKIIFTSAAAAAAAAAAATAAHLSMKK